MHFVNGRNVRVFESLPTGFGAIACILLVALNVIWQRISSILMIFIYKWEKSYELVGDNIHKNVHP